jgi:hypothetical protein
LETVELHAEGYLFGDHIAAVRIAVRDPSLNTKQNDVSPLIPLITRRTGLPDSVQACLDV